jgi:hypothetical protein
VTIQVTYLSPTGNDSYQIFVTETGYEANWLCSIFLRNFPNHHENETNYFSTIIFLLAPWSRVRLENVIVA